MKRMDKKVLVEEEERRSIVWMLGVLFFCALVFSYFMPNTLGDDVTYLNRLNRLGYFGGAIDHYMGWSSRIIIETVLMFLSKYFILWKLLNAAIMTGTVYFLNKYLLSTINTKTLLLTFSVYCMIPLKMMGESGWVATSLNYHWAVFCALVAFYPFYKRLKDEELSTTAFVLSIIALIYAANQEQVNLCFLVFTILVSIYLIKTNRFDFKLTTFLIISVVGLFMFLLSPGNSARLAVELKAHYPDFGDYSFIEKINLGVLSFGKPFFLDFNILFFLIFALVFFLVFTKRKSYNAWIFAGFPVVLNLAIFLGNSTKPGFSHYAASENTLTFSSEQLSEWFSGARPRLSFLHPASWMAMLLILGLLACLSIGLILSFDNPKKRMAAVLLLLMGASARIIIGFSPTLWVSGIRTYYVTYVVAAMLVLMLIDELEGQKRERFTAVVTLLGICAFILTFFNK
ncbi:DUF6056 family protein [Enterococcus sp. BWR-S5]|uniref:DUF6056 family protein n=1 Tax=Enterococcus sp. BWR-S5 TaxID=2787714 RepID=UPI001924A999|nr:DUF6056 family protein [Enterococcus sp. BWR-S5]MBL1224294.1 benzoate/H(+) symporter BenE family transporter [Enterococcus sp. BWR-S5]